jgi:hypothetical protein
MEPIEVQQRLATLTAALRTFEQSLAAHDVPLDIVSDFKSSVDDLRLRLWGLLTARNADDQLVFQRRFRLRRLREMCLQIGTELREGEIPLDHEELHKLVVAARSLVTAASKALADHPA